MATSLADYLGPEIAASLPPPNYANPSTHVAAVLGTEISLTALMLLFVCMRFHARLRLKRLFGADDAVMGVAAATAVAHTVVTCVGTRHGIGYHMWDVRPASIPEGFKWTFTSILMFHPISALTKISVCFGPVNLFWNQPFSITRNCSNVLALLEATAALNSLGDLLVYLWPAKFLFKLQMPLKHRLGLITLFSFGCIVFTASICRMVYLPPAFASIDILYDSAILLLIASIEETVAIICGCLPSSKSFLSHHFPRLFGSTAARSSRAARSHADRYHPRPRGYGDSAGNHSVKVFAEGRGREEVEEEYELGWETGDERWLVGGAEGAWGPVDGIVKTQEVSVMRSASRGGRTGWVHGGRADGLDDGEGSVGGLTAVGDGSSLGKGSGGSG
ncbi:Integral membrane protein [Neofusicoccum parvum]|nr:Integral membrane protein [Neofusicoccum parvum]